MDSKTRQTIPWHGLKKIFPRTLFARSLLIIVIPVLLLQIVTTLVFVDNHWRKVTSRMAFAVAGEIAIITDDLDKSDNVEKVKKISTTYAQKLDLLVTFEPDAKLIPETTTAGAWGPFIANALKKSIDTQIRRPYSLSFSPENDWVNIGIQLDGGVLRVLVLERRLYSSSANIFLMWVLGTSLILFAIAVFFMRNQIRPIRKLSMMAERMGKGQDITGFKPEGAREVRQAARAFIDMHHRITRQVEQRTAMLAGVSHDLRTPLTRLKLGLSFIEETEDVKALKSDVIDMERMINSYLNFLRGDGEEVTEKIPLNTIISKVANGVQRHGNIIHADINPSLMVNVRPMAFERALQNLISNAEKYGSEIWVSVKDKTDDIIIMVDDNGIGLSPDLYEEVFKPFYRADESRNSATGGVGLGLPIVRDIIHAHGGQVHLEKSPKGGLRAVITLPI
jgi:two-component system osmolarity sensor histidine kinase EnvZ